MVWVRKFGRTSQIRGAGKSEFAHPAGLAVDRTRGPSTGTCALALDSSGSRYARMFTARAATRRTVIAESVASAAINALAGRVSGIASVGLNAVAFVSDT